MVDFRKNYTPAKQTTSPQKDENRGRQRQKRKSRTVTPLFSKNYLPHFIILVCILVYTTVIFSNAMHNSFLDWDDNAYVRDNVDIRALGQENIKTIFTNNYVGNWQPLTILTYAIEYSFVGAKSPVLYHIDNLILHLLNVLLIFVLCHCITRNKWAAGLAALLFSIHPLRVESVSWVAERKDVLYSFFFLLALVGYHYYLTRGLGINRNEQVNDYPDKRSANRYYALIIVSFILSGMAKSAAVVLPVVLLLFDYFYHRKLDAQAFIEKIPLFVIALFFGFMAMKSQDVAIRDWPDVNFVNRIFIINVNLLRYLFMSFVPVHLSALHPYPEIVNGKLPAFYYVAPLISLALASAIYYSLKFTRDILFGVLFFIVTIALVIQIIPVGVAVISERYTYMPNVIFFIILSIYLVKIWEAPSKYQPFFRVITGVMILVAIAGFSYGTYSRNIVWKEGMSLWTDVINKYPNSTYSGYYDRGKIKMDTKDYDGAMIDYNRAIHLNPNDFKAIINRGIIKQERGLLDSALVDYNRAIKINPNYNIVYNDRGAIKKIRNDLKGALEDFTKSIDLNPNQIEAQYNCGTVKFSLGDFKGAIANFVKVLQIQDNYLNTYNYLAASKFNSGDKTGACADWRRGAELGNDQCVTNLNNNCK